MDGGAGQVLAAALALSSSWAFGGSEGHGVPWGLSGLGEGGWEAWWSCASPRTLCQLRTTSGPCVTPGSLCQRCQEG